jgi:predicted membrane protein
MRINFRDWRFIILLSVIFYILWIVFVVYPQGLRVQELQRELSEKRMKLARAQLFPLRERQLDSAIKEEKARIEELKNRLYSYDVLVNLLKDIEEVSKKYGMDVVSISGPDKSENKVSFSFTLKGNYTNFVPWAYEISVSKTLNITQLNARTEEKNILFSGILETTPFEEVKGVQ